jgi:hypothetical protein
MGGVCRPEPPRHPPSQNRRRFRGLFPNVQQRMCSCLNDVPGSIWIHQEACPSPPPHTHKKKVVFVHRVFVGECDPTLTKKKDEAELDVVLATFMMQISSPSGISERRCTDEKGEKKKTLTPTHSHALYQ